ncbi:MAG TPA: tetratricopeptide repeat protein [Myxococcaceae bacterium]|jgi:tetratricopeptide (TPR) repeat protein
MRGCCVAVVTFLVAAACVPRAPLPAAPPPESLALDRPADPERLPLMGPAEVIRAIESSSVTYRVMRLEPLDPQALRKYASELWPQTFAEVPFPAIAVGAGGDRHLDRYPVNAAADRLLAEAEPHYRQRHFTEAAELYRRALDLRPDYYPALLDLGDLAQLQGQPEEALRRYERAVAVNPVDHRGHFLTGNALLELGRAPEALGAYAHALALRPHNKVVLDGIEARQQRLGIRLVRDFFLPRGLARPAAKGVDVLFDAERAHWVAWAACKGLWLGEVPHRQQLTGAGDHRFTALEETECLGVLLQAYVRERAGGDAEEEPDLERLGQIAAAGQLPELILYEMASRKSPHAMLLLEDDQRGRVEQFVRRFAFERRGPGLGPTYEVKR